MSQTKLLREADARSRAKRRVLAENLRQLMSDAGIAERELARRAGLAQSTVCRALEGTLNPTLETYERLAAVLGADLSVRLYPNTGPAIRDRHSAPMLEAVLSVLDRRWRPFTEVAVRTPSRGWIDVALQDSRERRILATEIQSELHRLEQLVRWHGAKAASLPSWEGWPRLGEEPQISRLLIVRRTRATRAVAAEFAQQLRVAYPAHPDDALAALTTPHAPWPGAALLWADVAGSKARLLAGSRARLLSGR
ncbi:MAG: helix-turn-helix domain-containing protein [Candidatus Limnocylindrales bacterium]